MSDEIAEKLLARAAELATASAHDDKDRYMNVVARLSREDGAIMSTAAKMLAALLADRDRMRAERDELREYAHKATCTITDLAGGGSELFSRKIGDMYTADLPFCKERIRAREATSHEWLLKAIGERNKARAALSEAGGGKSGDGDNK